MILYAIHTFILLSISIMTIVEVWLSLLAQLLHLLTVVFVGSTCLLVQEPGQQQTSSSLLSMGICHEKDTS